MGHLVTGIISKKSDAKTIADRIPFKLFYPLKQDFVIFPLTDELTDKHLSPQQDFSFEQFKFLSSELAELLKHASSGISLAYIETDYFGGVGLQSAIIFEGGQTVYGPSQAKTGPINKALRKIGVTRTRGFRDEFEAVGLIDIRSCEELLQKG